MQWGEQDSNLRRRSHQIYSLTPLTARESPLEEARRETAAPSSRTRHQNRGRQAPNIRLEKDIWLQQGRRASVHWPRKGHDSRCVAYMEPAEGLEPTTC